MSASSTAVAVPPPGAAAAPPDTRCMRCGGSTAEPTDPAQPCWDCAGTGLACDEPADIYRGEP